MRGFLSNLFALFAGVFAELIALAAFGLIAFGVSLVWFPGAFIVGGVLLLLAVMDARR